MMKLNVAGAFFYCLMAFFVFQNEEAQASSAKSSRRSLSSLFQHLPNPHLGRRPSSTTAPKSTPLERRTPAPLPRAYIVESSSSMSASPSPAASPRGPALTPRTAQIGMLQQALEEAAAKARKAEEKAEKAKDRARSERLRRRHSDTRRHEERDKRIQEHKLAKRASFDLGAAMHLTDAFGHVTLAAAAQGPSQAPLLLGSALPMAREAASLEARVGASLSRLSRKISEETGGSPSIPSSESVSSLESLADAASAQPVDLASSLTAPLSTPSRPIPPPRRRAPGGREPSRSY